MHISLAFLLYLLPLLSAAAPSPSSVTDNSSQLGSTLTPSPTNAVGASTVLDSHSASASGSKTVASSTHKPTSESAQAHHPVGPSSRPPIASGDGQNTFHPNPTFSHAAPIPSHHDDHPPHTSETTLVFEILGAVAGVIFFLSIVRCIYSYKRTPTHDRITSVIHRHQLQREMEELERHPPRRDSLAEPAPPPYVPRPPSYIDESTPLSNRESTASYSEDPFRPNG